MSVHYKFKSALESDTVSFDGLHISVHDLKNAIMQQKRIGKNNDFDLQVTNAETKEVYDNEDSLIPKNTSLLIARVPSQQSKPKVWEGYGDSSSPISKTDDLGAIGKAMDLSSLDAPEEDKIKAMMSQSTQDYDPSNYIKIRGANQVGAVPPNYRCYKCHQGGHWIKDCSLNQGMETIEIKKSTGIPRSFMVAVEGPQVQGAMITPNGCFAVPALDHQAYTEKAHPAPPLEETKTEIPEDLVCSLCSDLLTDAVMIPCCGDSYCDECIRGCLLESEEHECPACHEKDISPGTLIPNRYLRNSVTNFKSTTGYVKRPVYKPQPTPVKPAKPVIEPTPTLPPTVEPPKEIKADECEESLAKTETRENAENKDSKSSVAIEVKNSTAVSNSDNNFKEVNNKEEHVPCRITTEGPQKYSPRGNHGTSNTVHTIITSINSVPKRAIKMNTNERSPRRHYQKPSPTYHPRHERSGTPTVDEPGIQPSASVDPITSYVPSTPMYSTGPPPPNMGMIGIPPPNIQGPTGAFAQVPSFPPPNQGPMPPNFRLPPPAAAPYVTSGYTPRPMYDMGRGVPQYPPVYSSSSRVSKNREYHRDYPSSRRGRSPPTTIIDDPLEAFNRMLREKDERERRAKQRKTRSYSRSSSRSISPLPIRKGRLSRSPRRRSRSRSFSIGRSRSRSFSPGARISPAARNFSPKRPHRKMHSRYQSPGRSPQRYRYKDDDRDHRSDRVRDNHAFRDGDRERDFRDREPRDRDFKYFDGYDRSRGKGRHQWNGPRNQPEQYYPPPEMAVQQPYVPPNRYPPHDVYQPHIQAPPPHQPPSQIQHAPPIRQYEDDVVPPGTEQPPVPGLENAPSIEERYQYTTPKKEPEPIKQEETENTETDHDKMGGTPERKYFSPPPPHRKQERDREYQGTPEKHHKRRKHDDTTDRKKDLSDDERSSRKNKDKKKKKEKREKKEEERKKRRERREKREQEKLNKKALEEKEKYERKHKREVVKHDAETQASNDEDDENGELDMYDDRNNKYHHNIHEEIIDSKNHELEDSGQYEEVAIDHNDHDHDEVAAGIEEDSHEIEEMSTHRESPNSQIGHSPELKNTSGDLYGDILTGEIDNTVIKNYGRVKGPQDSPEIDTDTKHADDDKDEGEITDDEDEESEKDILELHTNEAELKMEVKNEVLAPLPERSKWEVDEDISLISSSTIGHLRGDSKLERTDKYGKVTNEVLKRAENAIFAKAINAIRPIEIKKISMDRAKLYSGERDKDKSGDELREEARNIHITITGGNNYDNDVVTVEAEKSPPKVRLSVKERLGCKVDELDRIVKIDKPYDRNRSHSLSPLSRRADLMSRNLGQGERRFDLDNRNRSNNRVNFRDRNRDYRQFRNDNRNDVRNNHRNRRDVRPDRDHRKDNRKDHRKGDNDKKQHDKRKSRSKSSTDEKDKHKKRDRKDKKKEKVKRHKKDGVEADANKQASTTKSSKNEDDKDSKMTTTTADKRKPTLDEASFEPDYDLESESEKEDASKKVEKTEKNKNLETKSSEHPEASRKRSKPENKKYDSSSSDSSESSSEDERKRRKHKKHKKRRTKRDSSSSSSSESESESSEDKHNRRHNKKKLKKKKKSKHK